MRRTLPDRVSRTLVAFFFVALTVIGLATVRDYGATYDELVEMDILESNFVEYADSFGASPDSFFARLDATRISQSKERDHGMCAYYPLALILNRIHGDDRAYSYCWSVLTWLWFMLGCVSLYGFLRALSAPRAVAAAGTLLLYLAPRFFAEGHYNNKDVVLLCLALFTLWQGAGLLKKPGFLRGLLFSLAGAMAANTKIAGVFPWGLIGAAVIVSLTANRCWSLRMAGVAAVTVAGFVVFYLLLTPAAWRDPLAFFRYLIANATSFSRFGGTVLFRGAEFYDIGGKTPLPRYYIPYYMLVTLPPYTLVLAAVGQLGALRVWFGRISDSVKREEPLLLMVATLSWAVPVLYAIVGRPLVYNGWRHFYFVYAGVVILAGYGLSLLWAAVRNRKVLRAVAAVAVAGCLGVTGVGLALNHPLEYAYFNFLQPRDARHIMDLDYWNISDSAAFLKLCDLKKDLPGPLRVGCYFNDIRIGSFKLPEAVNDRLEITTGTDEEYLYYNATYAYIYRAKEPPDGYHVLFELKSYGNTVGTMYEKDAPSDGQT